MGGEEANWARIAIRASEAKTTLLQHVGLIYRHVGTLFVDEGKESRALPAGAELAKRFEGVRVLDAELVSEAETAWLYGDQPVVEVAARAAADPKPPRNQ